ncbi:hypothetical protein PUNSTDRAFT_55277 [Punctularia strigosozonata HHB-11173 SS5]|uniref:Uncharacterized protein n=1 Tax=Punctularia strigosozonata (strain HHB-11173) TaxID=741275 RepID=R7S425_PUNST|nr:uncharacterized protein PUNSTDRAFT_55277 [Punctularia strigosozonata HHB-11173 SS5]EIN04968.1 hypothetical protein PUNSTDRAFT_55277 [Punctularia strigosozonata HHB-11173 SS5]
MADARALLKAKRQEVRITHPLATYNSAGQLRCTVCGTAVKHASAWEGHLGSKAHRTNVLRLKEEERKREEERAREEARLRAEQARGKRKADDETAGAGGKKAKLVDAASDDEGEDDESGSAYAGIPGQSGGFPADFFSDPSRAPPPKSLSDDEDEDADAAQQKPDVTGEQKKGPVDEEWEEFQKFVLAPDKKEVSHEAFQQATIVAEPVLNVVDAGMPTQGEDEAQVVEEEEDEETKWKRKEQEERELIMDRLMEEEQAQEEADMRAQSLKDRLAALKKKREAARAAKAHTKT